MTPEQFIAEAKRQGKSKEETKVVFDRLMKSGAFEQKAESKPVKRDFYQEAYDKKNPLEKFLIGAGGGMTGLYKGAKQRLDLADQGEIDRYKDSMKPVNDSGFGIAGNITGNVAGLAPAMFIPGANTYAGATALGAVTGALTPTSEHDSVAANMMLGAAGGAGGKYVGDKVTRLLSGNKSPLPKINIGSGTANSQASINGSMNMGFKQARNPIPPMGDDVSAGLTPSQNKLMNWGRESGFKLTPGQATGSKVLQQVEAAAESKPLTSGGFFAIKDNNQKTLNKIAAKAIGESTDTIDDTVLGSALTRIEGVYKKVADDTYRPINADDFLEKLTKIEYEFEGLLPQNIMENQLVKRLFGYAEKGEATGRQLQDLASKIGRKAYNEMTSAGGDREMGLALFQVKEHVDDLLGSNLDKTTTKAFAEARRQYRNLMLLTKRANVVNEAEGNVKGAALAGALKQADKKGYTFGRNQSDLYNAARFAKAFQPIVGDSGTGTRMQNGDILQGFASLPFTMTTKAYASSPVINATLGMANILNRGLAPNNRLLQQLAPRMGILGGGLLGGNAAQ